MRCCRIRGTIHKGATVTASLVRGQTVGAKVDKAMIAPPAYQGDYEATPSQSVQTFYTGGLLMSDHFKVNPIPSNYGLITWNGSTLTVS